MKSCPDIARAEAHLAAGPWDALVAGPSLMHRTGLRRLGSLHQRYPWVSVVLALHERPRADLAEIVRAGAEDLVPLHADDGELARALARATRMTRARLRLVAEGPGARDRGRTVMVASPSGGCGKTFLATNAADFLARTTGQDVVLVDLDLQFGQVATYLNIEPRQTLADVVRDEAAMREPELLRTYATKHDSGLHVLGAPHGPEQAELITADHVDKILSTLLETYDQVVIDTGSWLDERTLRAFANAENVVFVVNPEVATLKAVNLLVDYLNEAGTVAAKSMFVLNNLFGREIVKPRDVEQALGSKVDAELPYDPFLYLKAVNEGNPVVLGAPRSIVAERMTRLSDLVFGLNGSVPEPAQSKKSSSRFSFRRR